MQILPDLAANPKSHHMSPHLDGAVDESGSQPFMVCLSQVAFFSLSVFAGFFFSSFLPI